MHSSIVTTFDKDAIKLTTTSLYSTSMADNQECVSFPVKTLDKEAKLLVHRPVHHAGAPDTELVEDFVGSFVHDVQRIQKKANPELLAQLMLPKDIVGREAQKLAASFWLWLCVVDDELEDTKDDNHFDMLITAVERRFKPLDTSVPLPPYACTTVTDKFVALVNNSSLQSAHEWRQPLFDAVLDILHAFRVERPLLTNANANPYIALQTWMSVRIITISVRPFMILARAGLGLPADYQPSKCALFFNRKKAERNAAEMKQMELAVATCTGLQNDLIGWEKDAAENNILNSVEILRLMPATTDIQAFEAAENTHNEGFEKICESKLQVNGKEAVYVSILKGFTGAMAHWHMRAKRYATTA
ncbi:hypothetical protein BJ508DRAFT_326880 [Ascobolus immersus RN42]|uniref:Terpenoid synthase n=1 Tax=Ascobolus immersus RN42 TaxID=1160509 RepID=A0A3N4I4S0_ASCIM|nr:hypothetical protein BJ508DRAFT_326880 [Ascobolus immersus RN42]